MKSELILYRFLWMLRKSSPFALWISLLFMCTCAPDPHEQAQLKAAKLDELMSETLDELDKTIETLSQAPSDISPDSMKITLQKHRKNLDSLDAKWWPIAPVDVSEWVPLIEAHGQRLLNLAVLLRQQNHRFDISDANWEITLAVKSWIFDNRSVHEYGLLLFKPGVSYDQVIAVIRQSNRSSWYSDENNTWVERFGDAGLWAEFTNNPDYVARSLATIKHVDIQSSDEELAILQYLVGPKGDMRGNEELKTYVEEAVHSRAEYEDR